MALCTRAHDVNRSTLCLNSNLIPTAKLNVGPSRLISLRISTASSSEECPELTMSSIGLLQKPFCFKRQARCKAIAARQVFPNKEVEIDRYGEDLHS